MKVSLPYMSPVPAGDDAASGHHFVMMTDSLLMPDGNRASIHEMVAAQKSIQKFVVAAETRLQGIDDAMLYDFVVDQLLDLAAQYNQQLQRFTARQTNH